MTEPGSRATLRFSGLLLPQTPLMQARPEGGALECYRFDQLWRHTAGIRKHALHIGFSQERLEGVMQVQQRRLAQRIYEPAGAKPELHWQDSLGELEGEADPSLASSADVAQQLQRWWELACAQAACYRDAADDVGLPRRAFSRLHALLSRALMPHWSEDEAAASAEDDWLGQVAEQTRMIDGRAGGAGGVEPRLRRPRLSELQSVGRLSRARFVACVLELARVWSGGRSAAALALWLRRLADHLLAEHSLRSPTRMGGGAQAGPSAQGGGASLDPFGPLSEVAHAAWLLDFPTEAASIDAAASTGAGGGGGQYGDDDDDGMDGGAGALSAAARRRLRAQRGPWSGEAGNCAYSGIAASSPSHARHGLSGQLLAPRPDTAAPPPAAAAWRERHRVQGGGRVGQCGTAQLVMTDALKTRAGVLAVQLSPAASSSAASSAAANAASSPGVGGAGGGVPSSPPSVPLSYAPSRADTSIAATRGASPVPGDSPSSSLAASRTTSLAPSLGSSLKPSRAGSASPHHHHLRHHRSAASVAVVGRRPASGAARAANAPSLPSSPEVGAASPATPATPLRPSASSPAIRKRAALGASSPQIGSPSASGTMQPRPASANHLWGPQGKLSNETLASLAARSHSAEVASMLGANAQASRLLLPPRPHTAITDWRVDVMAEAEAEAAAEEAAAAEAAAEEARKEAEAEAEAEARRAAEAERAQDRPPRKMLVRGGGRAGAPDVARGGRSGGRAGDKAGRGGDKAGKEAEKPSAMAAILAAGREGRAKDMHGRAARYLATGRLPPPFSFEDLFGAGGTEDEARRRHRGKVRSAIKSGGLVAVHNGSDVVSGAAVLAVASRFTEGLHPVVNNGPPPSGPRRHADVPPQRRGGDAAQSRAPDGRRKQTDPKRAAEEARHKPRHSEAEIAQAEKLRKQLRRQAEAANRREKSEGGGAAALAAASSGGREGDEGGAGGVKAAMDVGAKLREEQAKQRRLEARREAEQVMVEHAQKLERVVSAMQFESWHQHRHLDGGCAAAAAATYDAASAAAHERVRQQQSSQPQAPLAGALPERVMTMSSPFLKKN